MAPVQRFDDPSIDEAHEAVLASIRRSYAGPGTFAEDRLRVTA